MTTSSPEKRATATHRLARENVTLVDVARLAGVSKITASRALSNPGMVAPETQRRVRDAVAEIGYLPNLVAGALKSNRTRLIACLVPTISSGSAFLVAVQAMTQVFAAHGYQVILGERGYGPSDEERLVEAVIARRPDGIVLTGIMQSEASRKRLMTAGIPVVETWDMTDTPIDMVVGFSHEQAGVAIAEFLYAKGRRKLAMITSTEPRGASRGRGFLAAACRLQLVDAAGNLPVHTVGAPSRMKHGRDGLVALLASNPEIDALYCASDLIALGALVEARSRGIAVPGHLAVVGFGDLDFAADTDPPLTTLHVDSGEIGRRAALSVIDRVEGQGEVPSIVDVGFSMIERAST